MRKLLIGLGIAAGLITLVVVSQLNSADGTPVEVTAAETHDLRSSILASGQIAYREDVELRSEVIGQVVELLVEEGDRVKKGDVVLRLDPEAIQAEVAQRAANVRQQEIAIKTQQLTIENLERQWRRKKQLAEQGLIDESSFETATNELAIARLNLKSQQQVLKQARAQLSQADERLSKTVINAPMDGMVTGVFVEEGETVIAGTTNIAGSTMLTIADPSAILSKVQVDEADIANVSVGQGARVYAAAYPDTPFKGTVESVATTARTVTGRQGLSFEVEILLQPQSAADKAGISDLRLRPGMSARAEIFTSSAEGALAVPLQAVLYPDYVGANSETDNASSPYVFVVEEGLAVKTPVTLGISNDMLQQVTDGLELGDQVIIGPIATLRHLNDDALVTITQADKSSSMQADTQSESSAADNETGSKD